MNRSHAIYREIFGNAGDFTFIFTGNFPKDELLSLCRKYLGNLSREKSKKGTITEKSLKRYKLPKSISHDVYSTEFMEGVKVQLVYASKLNHKKFDWKDEIRFKLLRQLLKFSMSQKMRFHSDKGGIYTVSVGINPKKDRLFNEIFVRFSCSPEDVDRLILEAKEEINSFRNDEISTEKLEQFKHSLILDLENNYNERKVVSEKLYHFYKNDLPWYTLHDEKEFINSISRKDIKDAAKKLLQNKPFEFKMIPLPKL